MINGNWSIAFKIVCNNWDCLKLQFYNYRKNRKMEKMREKGKKQFYRFSLQAEAGCNSLECLSNPPQPQINYNRELLPVFTRNRHKWKIFEIPIKFTKHWEWPWIVYINCILLCKLNSAKSDGSVSILGDNLWWRQLNI